jgi:hypothetical protein
MTLEKVVVTLAESTHSLRRNWTATARTLSEELFPFTNGMRIKRLQHIDFAADAAAISGRFITTGISTKKC